MIMNFKDDGYKDPKEPPVCCGKPMELFDINEVRINHIPIEYDEWRCTICGDHYSQEPDPDRE